VTGDVRVNGDKVTKDIIKRNVGYVHQLVCMRSMA
jgi:hypothetical protein